MLKIPNILDIIGLFSLKLTAMVNQKDKKSGLTDGSSRSGGGLEETCFLFLLKRGNLEQPGVSEDFELRIAPGANNAYREHNNIFLTLIYQLFL